mgnify:CR=1 FL=1
MNKKGFTLVELMASLVILSLISVLMFSTIQTSSNNVKKKNYENIKKMIIESTISYMVNSSDGEYSLDKVKGTNNKCNEILECAREYTVGEILEKNIYYSSTKNRTKNSNDELTIINPITGEGMRNKKFLIYYDTETY